MFIDFVGLLVEGDVHQGEVVLDFHLCVAVHGGAALTVESGCVEVDLHFAHHVHVGLSGQFGGSLFIKRDIDVVVLFLVVYGHLAVYAGKLDDFADFFIVLNSAA